LIKLRAARRAAEADVRISQSDLRKAEDEVALRTRTLYFQILIGRFETQAATLQIAASDQTLKENADAVLVGNVLEVASMTQRTNLLQAKYQLRQLENHVSDLTAQLNELMGLPIDSELDLEPVAGESDITLVSLPEYTELAMKQNPEIQSAIEVVDKARQGVRIAKAEYIPNVGVFGQYAYQNGVPFLVHNNATFGVRMTWDLFDWGKRSSSVGEKESELARALENVERLKRRIAVRVERSYRDVELAGQMIETARSALYQAQETSRLDGHRYAVGVSLASDGWKAKAGEAYAKANVLRANLSYVLAKSELDVAVGSAPR
jgi:outer membrane protein TolC